MIFFNPYLTAHQNYQIVPQQNEERSLWAVILAALGGILCVAVLILNIFLTIQLKEIGIFFIACAIMDAIYIVYDFMILFHDSKEYYMNYITCLTTLFWVTFIILVCVFCLGIYIFITSQKVYGEAFGQFLMLISTIISVR